MQEDFLKCRKHQFLGLGLLPLLLCILVACGTDPSIGISTPSATSTSSGTSVASASPTVAVPGVVLGVQPCPATVSNPTHWDPIIPTQANIDKVESVTCANLMGNATLQALVNVRADGTGQILSAYVYNNITNASPTKVFMLQDLYKGSAKISGYNTLITGEVDQGSHINSGQSNAGFRQDLFREFKWSDGAGTLVQVAFPGIFPDLTRYQAEDDQQQVNQGHDPWKIDAGMVSTNLAVSLLQWPIANAQATIVSGGGQHDLDAVVTVKNTHPGGGAIKVTLSRLEGNANGGIWEAIAVESTGMSIITPAKLNNLASPFASTGTGNAFEGKIGKVIVLDHLYTDIGHADANGAIGNGNTSFSTNVSYQASFHGGSQEGLVVLYTYSNADGSIAGAVMVKELLSA